MHRGTNLRVFIITLLISLGLPVAVLGEEGVLIHNGFITGNTFRAFDQVSKNVYVTGLVDGILLAPLYGAPKKNLEKIEKCTVGMTGQQIVAILEKYLRGNPERWHHGMHVISYSALGEACSK